MLNKFYLDLFEFFQQWERVLVKCYSVISQLLKQLLIKNSIFLNLYYLRNENIWVDGFLLDFLQKKSTDLWLRKFIIYTGFLFSERLVFDTVTRLYLDTLLWPAHYISTFEVSNVTELLNVTLYFYFGMFALLALSYIILI